MNTFTLCIIGLIGYIVAFCDASTDACIDTVPGVDKFEWHVAKWVRYYTPFILIVVLLVANKIFKLTVSNAIIFVVYCIGGWLLWRVAFAANFLLHTESSSQHNDSAYLS